MNEKTVRSLKQRDGLLRKKYSRRKNNFLFYSNDVVALTDASGKITNYNPAWGEVFAETSNNILGKHLSFFLYKDDFPDVKKIFREVSKNKYYRFKGRTIQKDSNEHIFDWQLFKDRNGFIITGKDITEAVNSHEMLAKRIKQISLERLVAHKCSSILETKKLFDTIVNDIQNSFSYFNVALLHYDKEKGILGRQSMAGEYQKVAAPDYTQSDSIGMIGYAARFGEVSLSNDVSKDSRYIVGFNHTVPTASEVSIPVKLGNEVLAVLDIQETRINAFDEIDIQSLQTLASQIAVAIKNANLFESINREMEERKTAEQSLKNRERELKELNEWKDQLFSIIAHDLRSPFQALIGVTDLLSDDYNKFDDVQRIDIISKINLLSKDTFKILANLLDWSVLQLGNLNIDPEMVDINEALNEILDSLNYSVISKNIKIEKIISINITAYIDPYVLSIILRNIIINAIKFSNNHNKIIIEVFENQEAVEISVKDFGIGISLEQQHRLLCGNNVLHAVGGTNGEKGTGLGLILCKQFLEKSHGKLWFESTINEGSTFHIRIPSQKKGY